MKNAEIMVSPTFSRPCCTNQKTFGIEATSEECEARGRRMPISKESSTLEPADIQKLSTDCIEKTLSKDRIQKIRRRIEDYIRKSNDTRLILMLAKALKIKIED